ncbi:putative membrane protein [Brucella rhizosphaerae]|uniref:Putative membrane protein n=1 Tax=Brucella rhizosphaerae TaxID=571254 RepID=A0A256FCM9_9HYPH|nr:putative membrane protein [Brucella rhizosphaerae]
MVATITRKLAIAAIRVEERLLALLGLVMVFPVVLNALTVLQISLC